MTVQDRMARHPQMRASTLAYLQKRDALLAQLQREIREQAEADRAVNSFRDDVDWKRGPNPILIFAGKLKVLALRAKELVN